MNYRIPAVFFFSIAVALAADPSTTPPAPADPATANQTPVKSPDLWIVVHLPKETRPAWVGDDLAESFANRISRALHDQGLKGAIGTLRPEEALPPHASVLEVTLTEWTANAGSGECTFRALLHTQEGTWKLGLFSANAMRVTASGEHPVSSSGLGTAASIALTDLYRRMEEARHIPPQKP
jgi:hypothetical protein